MAIQYMQWYKKIYSFKSFSSSGTVGKNNFVDRKAFYHSDMSATDTYNLGVTVHVICLLSVKFYNQN